MKYAITLIVGYYLPNILSHVNFDMALGIVTGVIFALFVAYVMYAAKPVPRHAPAMATRKPIQPRRIIEQPTKRPAYMFVPTNYEWSVA